MFTLRKKERSSDGADRPSKPVRNVKKTTAKSSAKLFRHLSRPLILEEGGPPRSLQHMMLAISFLVGGFILWASVTELPENAVAQGQVKPAGSVHVVQHLEGGIVADIFVKEGEIVETGETVLRMEPASALGELEQLRAREAALALQIERMKVFVLGGKPDFAVGVGHPDLVRDQRQILDIQRQARSRQRKVMLSRIEQRRAEIRTLGQQARHVRGQIKLIREQLGMRRELLKKGLVSRTVYLETERTVSQARGELARIVGEQGRLREAVTEARGNLVELDARLSNEALKEMGALSSEPAQVREALSKQEDRVNRLNVIAPSRGVVKGLATRTVGAVITPGQELMHIVPVDDDMVAEVQIRPLDIGHLTIGQPARVKVTTYDIARYGPVNGVLNHISATTFKDEKGLPYYKGIIELKQNYVGATPGRNPILPGMVVDADINTGRKTLMRYLLKPVLRWSDASFNER